MTELQDVPVPDAPAPSAEFALSTSSLPTKDNEAAAYETPAREKLAIRGYLAMLKDELPLPRWKISRSAEGVYLTAPDHPNPTVGIVTTMQALGIRSEDTLHRVIHQLLELSQVDGEVDERRLNQLLASVKGVQPSDEVELMLAVQMAAVHDATMVQARRLRGADAAEQIERDVNTLAKLTRTFTAQVSTLKTYRTGGEQKVTVEHVHVHEGGQAIVGSVSYGPGATPGASEKLGVTS